MTFPKGSNYLIGDYSAIVGTTSTGLIAYTTTIALSNGHFPNQDAAYLVTSENNSTATDVTAIAYNLHDSFGLYSTNQWSELTRWAVEKTSSTTLGTIKDKIVQGWLIGSGGRLGVSNVSTGSSDLNAAVYFRIRKI